MKPLASRAFGNRLTRAAAVAFRAARAAAAPSAAAPLSTSTCPPTHSAAAASKNEGAAASRSAGPWNSSCGGTRGDAAAGAHVAARADGGDELPAHSPTTTTTAAAAPPRPPVMPPPPPPPPPLGTPPAQLYAASLAWLQLGACAASLHEVAEAMAALVSIHQRLAYSYYRPPLPPMDAIGGRGGGCPPSSSPPARLDLSDDDAVLLLWRRLFANARRLAVDAGAPPTAAAPEHHLGGHRRRLQLALLAAPLLQHFICFRSKPVDHLRAASPATGSTSAASSTAASSPPLGPEREAEAFAGIFCDVLTLIPPADGIRLVGTQLLGLPPPAAEGAAAYDWARDVVRCLSATPDDSGSGGATTLPRQRKAGRGAHPSGRSGALRLARRALAAMGAAAAATATAEVASSYDDAAELEEGVREGALLLPPLVRARVLADADVMGALAAALHDGGVVAPSAAQKGSTGAAVVWAGTGRGSAALAVVCGTLPLLPTDGDAPHRLLAPLCRRCGARGDMETLLRALFVLYQRGIPADGIMADVMEATIVGGAGAAAAAGPRVAEGVALFMQLRGHASAAAQREMAARVAHHCAEGIEKLYWQRQRQQQQQQQQRRNSRSRNATTLNEGADDGGGHVGDDAHRAAALACSGPSGSTAADTIAALQAAVSRVVSVMAEEGVAPSPQCALAFMRCFAIVSFPFRRGPHPNTSRMLTEALTTAAARLDHTAVVSAVLDPHRVMDLFASFAASEALLMHGNGGGDSGSAASAAMLDIALAGAVALRRPDRAEALLNRYRGAPGDLTVVHRSGAVLGSASRRVLRKELLRRGSALRVAPLVTQRESAHVEVAGSQEKRSQLSTDFSPHHRGRDCAAPTAFPSLTSAALRALSEIVAATSAASTTGGAARAAEEAAGAAAAAVKTHVVARLLLQCGVVVGDDGTASAFLGDPPFGSPSTSTRSAAAAQAEVVANLVLTLCLHIRGCDDTRECSASSGLVLPAFAVNVFSSVVLQLISRYCAPPAAPAVLPCSAAALLALSVIDALRAQVVGPATIVSSADALMRRCVDLALGAQQRSCASIDLLREQLAVELNEADGVVIIVVSPCIARDVFVSRQRQQRRQQQQADQLRADDSAVFVAHFGRLLREFVAEWAVEHPSRTGKVGAVHVLLPWTCLTGPQLRWGGEAAEGPPLLGPAQLHTATQRCEGLTLPCVRALVRSPPAEGLTGRLQVSVVQPRVPAVYGVTPRAVRAAPSVAGLTLDEAHALHDLLMPLRRKCDARGDVAPPGSTRPVAALWTSSADGDGEADVESGTGCLYGLLQRCSTKGLRNRRAARALHQPQRTPAVEAVPSPSTPRCEQQQRQPAAASRCRAASAGGPPDTLTAVASALLSPQRAQRRR